MSLIERLEQVYQQNVDNVDRGVSTTSTNLQRIEIKHKNDGEKTENDIFGPQNQKNAASKNPTTTRGCEENSKMSTMSHACAGVENHLGNTLLLKNTTQQPPLVVSFARASDNVDKSPDCESCPACGHWDGYGPWQMPAGRYCFHTAYYKGKAARPVPVADAKNICPLTMAKTT
jgi:hypothetical protein